MALADGLWSTSRKLSEILPKVLRSINAQAGDLIVHSFTPNRPPDCRAWLVPCLNTYPSIQHFY